MLYTCLFFRSFYLALEQEWLKLSQTSLVLLHKAFVRSVRWGACAVPKGVLFPLLLTTSHTWAAPGWKVSKLIIATSLLSVPYMAGEMASVRKGYFGPASWMGSLCDLRSAECHVKCDSYPYLQMDRNEFQTCARRLQGEVCYLRSCRWFVIHFEGHF